MQSSEIFTTTCLKLPSKQCDGSKTNRELGKYVTQNSKKEEEVEEMMKTLTNFLNTSM